jgi:UDP-N-acetyl-D-mannosaminuronate dehydrogenase
VLGLTYRENVREVAYSRAIPLIERLRFHGAEVWGYDPLLGDADVERLGARPYGWGSESGAQAIVVQTADPRFRDLDLARFPSLRVLFDGRNALRELPRPESVRYVGVGLPNGRDGATRSAGRRAAVAAGRPGGR